LTHFLLNPNLAFVFFYAALILIVAELLHPGISVPGVLGVMFFGLAVASFSRLPIQLAGVVLLMASVALFLLELKHGVTGAAAIAGMVTLVLGGLFLFDRSVPSARVSPVVITVVAVVTGGFFAFVVKAALKARRLPPAQGLERLIGLEGVATTVLDPSGVVRVASETWSADSARPVPDKQRVRVLAVEGLRLKVEPLAQDDELLGPGEEPATEGEEKKT